MKVKVKAFLHWRKHSWEEDVGYTFFSCDMSHNGTDYALISEHELEVEIPDDFDPRPQQIAVLKAKKQEILAEAHVKATNIDEQISRLLCIENKVDV